MDTNHNPFELAGSTVLVHGRPLPMSAEGFQILWRGNRHSAWLKNAEGYYYLESDLAPSTLKQLTVDELTAIDGDYASDRHRVYWGATPIPGSDPATFRIIGHDRPNVHYFAFDRHQLYALSDAREGLQIWTDVDTASLVFFENCSVFADRNHPLCFNGHFIEYAHPAISIQQGLLSDILRQLKPDADAWWNWSDAYFANLTMLGYAYRGDGQRVFHHFAEGLFDYPFPFGNVGDNPYFAVLSGADPSSFEALNDCYATDTARVYHLARPIDADPGTFRVIEGQYAVDRSGIWFNGYLCPDADPASFEILCTGTSGTVGFARDKRSVFSTIYGSRIGKFKGYSRLLKPLKNSDPLSFVQLNSIWAKDTHGVYCHGTAWKGIDASSFEYLCSDPEFNVSSYAKCANGLYDANGRRTVKGINGATFRMLNRYWGSDDERVFSFKTSRVHKTIDAATFEIVGDAGHARDKEHDYSFDECGALVAQKRRGNS